MSGDTAPSDRGNGSIRATGGANGSGAAAEPRAAELRHRYAGLDGTELLRPIVEREFKGRIALVSSFGAESAVVLALVAEIEPATPVIFLDTGKHFEATLRYRDALARRLGLTDVRSIEPDAAALARLDPTGELWRAAPDTCCFLRKVAPLSRALAGFESWITGRKRFQNGHRSTLATIESVEGKVKINPLAPWSRERIEAEFRRRGLPRHPLEAEGFLSIGCVPCTARVAPGDQARSGRWPDSDKTECGIHLPQPEAPPT